MIQTNRFSVDKDLVIQGKCIYRKCIRLNHKNCRVLYLREQTQELLQSGG